MSAHRRTSRSIAALALATALVLAACGGGGSSSDGSSSGSDSKSTTTAGGSDNSATLPDFEPEPGKFKEVDEGQARFINLLEHDGEGVDIDVYWGNNAETGKKATTLRYGEVSDWMPMEVQEDALLTPADGSTEVNVVFFEAGETDTSKQLIQQSETLEDGLMLTYALGTGDGSMMSDQDRPAASLSVGFENEAGEPPAGKAWVAMNSVGLGGIEDGDFMVLSSADGCDDLTGTDIEGGTANSGQAFLVDPGTQSFTASDANTECAERTEPVELDLADGDRYVLYAYGTSLEDRKLLPLKIGEE